MRAATKVVLVGIAGAIAGLEDGTLGSVMAGAVLYPLVLGALWLAFKHILDWRMSMYPDDTE